jgi:hypothetical protein
MAWMTAYAVLFLTLFATMLLPLWRRDPITRFFSTGMLLAMFPVCSGFPSDRLLVFVGIGAMGLIAQLAASATTFGARSFSAFLLFVHLGLAPPLLALRARFIDYQAPTSVALRTIPSSPDIATKSVVLVNPPNDLFQVYVSAARAVRGEPYPVHLWGLADVVTWVDATRVDDHTLVIHPAQGFLEHDGDQMLRDPRTPLPAGAEVILGGMKATVLDSTPDGRPSSVSFRFDAKLEDPQLIWLCWTREGYAPWTPPQLGETKRLPAHDFRRFILDLEDRLRAMGS